MRKVQELRGPRARECGRHPDIGSDTYSPIPLRDCDRIGAHATPARTCGASLSISDVDKDPLPQHRLESLRTLAYESLRRTSARVPAQIVQRCRVGYRVPIGGYRRTGWR